MYVKYNRIIKQEDEDITDNSLTYIRRTIKEITELIENQNDFFN
jgi:hypothetical protein